MLATENPHSTLQAVPDTVQIAVSLGRRIIVHNNIDTLNIDTAAEDIGGDQDALFKVFEGLVAVDTTAELAMSKVA